MKELKRSVALLLAALMLFACMSGVGMATDEISEDTTQAETVEQVSDFGTTVDPETGEEYPILSSVEDILPEEDAEPIPVGAAEAEESESGGTCLEDFAGAYDTTEIVGVDLSSCRILVAAEDAETIITEDAVIAELDGLYLMQFEDEDTAKLAYMYYNDMADYADADIPIMIADDDVIAIEDADTNPVEMDEETNPFAEAQSTIAALENGSGDDATPVIALIDTGANGESITRYSVMGDDGADNHGHGTRLVEIIADIFPEAQIISIKATDDSGVGSTSTIYAAIQLAVELHADIINLSVYGLRSTENSALETAIQTAIGSGITVVGAAGNSGKDASNYIPGCIGAAVIVGSVNEDGTLASFSNYGENVDYYVVSGSTSEAAATVSALTAADCLIVDNEHIYTSYTERSDGQENDAEALWSAQTFIYTFLCDPEAAAEAFGLGDVPPAEELAPYVYNSADEDSYTSILLSVDIWNQELSDTIRREVNGIMDGWSYESLAHEAYDYLLEYHDGQLRLDFITLDY